MVVIILERVKGNEWEIKSEKGSTLCRDNHESTEDAIEWCKNYMTSFQFGYEIKIINSR
jgi:hypothetical protein